MQKSCGKKELSDELKEEYVCRESRGKRVSDLTGACCGQKFPFLVCPPASQRAD